MRAAGQIWARPDRWRAWVAMRRIFAGLLSWGSLRWGLCLSSDGRAAVAADKRAGLNWHVRACVGRPFLERRGVIGLREVLLLCRRLVVVRSSDESLALCQ